MPMRVQCATRPGRVTQGRFSYYLRENRTQVCKIFSYRHVAFMARCTRHEPRGRREFGESERFATPCGPPLLYCIPRQAALWKNSVTLTNDLGRCLCT